MATDTEAEFRCGRVVAFRKTGDFHIEPERDAARLGVRLSNLLKKKTRRSDRDFEVFVSVRRKKRRQDSELKLQAGVFGYRRGVCLDLLHQSRCPAIAVRLVCPAVAWTSPMIRQD